MSVTPRLHEELIHLGAWMPFDPSRKVIERFRRVHLSGSTVRRMTEKAGAIYERQQEAAGAELERVQPPTPAGATTTMISVDGAHVPLRGGVWAEAKTLVVGEVGEAIEVKGKKEVHTQAHSTYSRLADAETFQQGALLELHRRGVNASETVVAPADGAEWIDGFVKYHCPQAHQILDPPHAAERLTKIGLAIAPTLPTEEGVDAARWAAQRTQELIKEGPQALLKELKEWTERHPEDTDTREHYRYLAKREDRMAYPQYIEAGWPIGSGSVESSNKLVVEARMKGSGMHWARANVNPMLTLRNAVCSDRWDEAVREIQAGLRQEARDRSNERRRQRAQERLQAATDTLATPLPIPGAPPQSVPIPLKVDRPAKPTAPHPWRAFNPGYFARC